MIKKAGTILLDKDNKKIGLVYRKKQDDISFPKGHLEENETLEECAIRETLEETGRNCKLLEEEPIYIDKYNNKEGSVEVYYFLAEDLGKINEEIDEELIWVKIDKVLDILEYESLKEIYRNVYDKIINVLGGSMKEILYATSNISKINRYKDKLLERGIIIKSIKEFDINIDVDENGNTAIENAIIKAKAYNEASDLPTMATDDTMFIEGIPEDKQPGIYVRRINGKRLSDEEMIEYYTNLVKEYGKDGKLDTKWVLGMVIIKDGKVYTHEETTSEYYLVDTPSKDIREGYPLSSILFNKKANKYDIYLTEEDKKIGQADDIGFINFIDEVVNK